MQLRTRNDFDNPNKLKNPLKKPPKSLTNYEAYLTDEKRAITKGYFMNDPQRLAKTKHAAGY